MPLSKEQAKVQGLSHQLDQFLASLAGARGRLEVIAHVATELLKDEVTARALDPLIEEMSKGLDQAGNAARAALDRTEHVRGALKS